MQVADRRGCDENEVLRWSFVRFLMWAQFYGVEMPKGSELP